MLYSKTIVCLANSWKLGGQCIAGKEILPTGFGLWIRPVSQVPSGELRGERYYADGTDPKLLDKITIRFLKPSPHGFQTENHVVDPNLRWVKEGVLAWDELAPALDTPVGSLWVNGHSTYRGLNDEIPEREANRLTSSLALIEPNGLVLTIDTEGREFGNPRRRVRADFRLYGERYVLPVTDPVANGDLQNEPDGTELHIPVARLCISIGEPFKERGACYKLVAAVIRPDRPGA